MRKKIAICFWLLLIIVSGMVNVKSVYSEHSLLNVIKAANVQIKEDQLWVEVSLKKEGHKVLIREGRRIMRVMPCSGGTKEEPTIMGAFYLENRGEWFYSERFQEGGLYWVRFYEQYLFHSTPVDRDMKVIVEEKEKIGGPASHGCIRLLVEDAKWFYINIPDGTLVVIHE